MQLLAFFLTAILISLTGVMAPGSITAATIAQGTRSRYAGPLISIGHGIVEIPLIFLIIFGLGTILKTDSAKIAIGLIGGAFLIWMGAQMLREIRKPDFTPDKTYTTGPILTGIILSATNPYFLFWWATVGLNLAIRARDFGLIAFAAFAIIHWLCDLIWLSILSFAASAGTTILSPRNQKIILALCAAALIFFGVLFIIDAAKTYLT
jgi:threonine/homoserine/homoserine lactone efflux protein